MTAPVIRRAEVADIDPLAAVLAEAFSDDPLSQWMFGSDDRLRDKLRASFRAIMRRVYIGKGHSYTTEDLAGAAIWAPPGKWKLSTLQQLRLVPTYMRLVPAHRLRAAGRLNVLLERGHPDEPHWHLSVLGVDPRRQRAGIGGALMTPILERADGERLLCYLEVSKPENIPYYERHGFQVTADLAMPSDAPPMWTMARLPM